MCSVPLPWLLVLGTANRASPWPLLQFLSLSAGRKFLRTKVWIEKRNRQEIESRVERTSNEYCKKSEFIT